MAAGDSVKVNHNLTQSVHKTPSEKPIGRHSSFKPPAMSILDKISKYAMCFRVDELNSDCNISDEIAYNDENVETDHSHVCLPDGDEFRKTVLSPMLAIRYASLLYDVLTKSCETNTS